MLPIIEFFFWLVTATLFVGSSGIWYRERHRSSLALALVTGAIALISTVDLLGGLVRERGKAEDPARVIAPSMALALAPTTPTVPTEGATPRDQSGEVAMPELAETTVKSQSGALEFSQHPTDVVAARRSNEQEVASAPRPKIELKHRGS